MNEWLGLEMEAVWRWRRRSRSRRSRSVVLFLATSLRHCHILLRFFSPRGVQPAERQRSTSERNQPKKLVWSAMSGVELQEEEEEDAAEEVELQAKRHSKPTNTEAGSELALGPERMMMGMMIIIKKHSNFIAHFRSSDVAVCWGIGLEVRRGSTTTTKTTTQTTTATTTMELSFRGSPSLRIVVFGSLSHLRRHRFFSILSSALFICSAASVLIISVSANWR